MNNNAISNGASLNRNRQSNIELFRIITMLLIVAHHYVVNSGLTSDVIYDNPMSFPSIFLLLFGAWGKMGINCFILITGYFMCKSQISVLKYCKLLLEVAFYNIVFYLIFLLSGYQSFSIVTLVRTLLPIKDINTGFTSCYLLFFLCIPFLNILIRNLSERQHIKLIALFVLIYVIIGTFPLFDVTMNYVSWFSVLYLIASFVRLYPKKLFDNTKFWMWSALILLILSAVSVIVCARIGEILNRDGIAFFFLSDSNRVMAVVTAFSGFMFFKNLKIKYNPFINTVAASTFGVLLIHANCDSMRQWLWKDMLNNVGMYNSPYLPLHAVGSVLAIFVVCVAIDYLRIRFLERPFFGMFEKRLDRITTWFNEKENDICEKFHIS